MASRFNLTVPASEHDHIKGPDHAAATIVGYGECECPYRGQTEYVIDEI